MDEPGMEYITNSESKPLNRKCDSCMNTDAFINYKNDDKEDVSLCFDCYDLKSPKWKRRIHESHLQEFNDKLKKGGEDNG